MGLDQQQQLDPVVIIFYGSGQDIKDTCALNGSTMATKTASGAGKCRRTFPFDSLIWCVSIFPILWNQLNCALCVIQSINKGSNLC